jgi:chorismate dehydratase
MRIALVEYLNTYPFSLGMQKTGFDKLHTIQPVIPSQCAVLYKEGAVDISLCPVGALKEMPAYDVVGKYCIGANGPVKTVVLLSKVPLNQIKSVRLDNHSRTSNLLLQVLAARHWQTSWSYYDVENNGSAESCLMIGDKVFENAKAYPFQYDLAEAWKALTGLPMVFAVWIANPDVPADVIAGIDQSFEVGMEAIKAGETNLEKWQIDYLIKSISYTMDFAKREALKVFLQYSSALPTPGTIR